MREKNLLNGGLAGHESPHRQPSGVPLSSAEARVRVDSPDNLPQIDAITSGEFDVPSALPWLALGVLHRLRYLDVVYRALEECRLTTRGSCYAAALAFKLARAPSREWRRQPDTEQVAAVFAGLREPVTKPMLGDFARQFEVYSPILDAQLAHTVISGRTPDSALLVASFPAIDVERITLLDSDGLFPIWWGIAGRHLPVTLHRIPRAEFVVLHDDISANILDGWHRSGICFYTAAYPTRSESWERHLITGCVPWSSNRPGSPGKGIRRQLLRSDRVRPRVEQLTSELNLKRVAIPVGNHDEFERSIAHAVAVALGTIAWILWHDREQTDALLALERFGDLSARVRFSHDAVRIVLPLGKRHRDLYEHGLLRSLPGIPWLGNRTMEFSGG